MRTLPRFTPAVLGTALVSAPLLGQSGGGISASENFVLAPGLVSEAGGLSASNSYAAAASIGQPLVLGRLNSLNFEFLPSAIVPGVALELGSAPRILGLSPPACDPAGGERVRLFGLNLLHPTGAAPWVQIGGAFAAEVQALTPTALELTTPAGTSSSGNPLGAVAVTLNNGVAKDRLSPGFLYGPALYVDPPEAGGRLRLHCSGPPGTWFRVMAGTPAAPTPVTGIAGAFELCQERWFGPPVYAAGGSATLDISIPFRTANSALYLQAVALLPGPLRHACFTNPTAVATRP